MRLPSITTPLPVTSAGEAFSQGRNTSGYRVVEKILTTEFATASKLVSALAGTAVAISGLTASGLVSVSVLSSTARLLNWSATTPAMQATSLNIFGGMK